MEDDVEDIYQKGSYLPVVFNGEIVEGWVKGEMFIRDVTVPAVPVCDGNSELLLHVNPDGKVVRG